MKSYELVHKISGFVSPGQTVRSSMILRYLPPSAPINIKLLCATLHIARARYYLAGACAPVLEHCLRCSAVIKSTHYEFDVRAYCPLY